MKYPHFIFCSLAAVCFPGFFAYPVCANTIIESWTINAAVPDNSSVGISDTRQFNADITEITEVTVTLNVTGGWGGDFFAYVVHNSGYSVLLNRIGRSSTDLLGNPASGLQLTFTDTVLTDVHVAPSSASPLIGIFQPDGRTADPSLVLTTSPRTKMLSSFNGLAAGGTWTLFVADVSPGDGGTVQSWGLKVTGVPEPSTGALLGLTICLWNSRRQRRN